MSATAATGEQVPEQIEAEDLKDGTVLVKWRGVEEPSWISQKQTLSEGFKDVLAEWESAKASGLALGQDDGSSESVEEGTESDDESSDAPSGMEQLGMQAAVRAAESGVSCATAAASAAAAVRAGGGSKEEQASAASSAAAFVAVVQGLAPREAAAAAADAFDAAEGAFDAGENGAIDPEARAAATQGTNAGRSKRPRSASPERNADGDEAAAAAPASTTAAKKVARAPDSMSAEEEAAWVRTFEARFRSTLR